MSSKVRMACTKSHLFTEANGFAQQILLHMYVLYQRKISIDPFHLKPVFHRSKLTGGLSQNKKAIIK
jgi:hypothetical protein